MAEEEYPVGNGGFIADQLVVYRGNQYNIKRYEGSNWVRIVNRRDETFVVHHSLLKEWGYE